MPSVCMLEYSGFYWLYVRLNLAISAFFLVTLKAGKDCIFNPIFELKIFKHISKITFISYMLQFSVMMKFASITTAPLLYIHSFHMNSSYSMPKIDLASTFNLFDNSQTFNQSANDFPNLEDILMS